MSTLRSTFSIFPVMLIGEKELTYWIDNFYGYGSWQARFWFIGHEESGGDLPEEVAEKINYFYNLRATNPTLCDIRELYRHVNFRIDGPRAEKFTTFHDHRFGPHATLHGAWKNLIAFVQGYKSEKLSDPLAYQKNSFTLPPAHTEALIQLYPLPAHNHAWYYPWLDLPQLPFLKSRTAYQDHLYPIRIHTILQNMIVYKPEVVMMYGMENINVIKESVHEVFPGSKFKMVKAIKHLIPQHHRVDANGTPLILTTQIPTLRHNRIETGFDWYAFGKLAGEG